MSEGIILRPFSFGVRHNAVTKCSGWRWMALAPSVPPTLFFDTGKMHSGVAAEWGKALPTLGTDVCLVAWVMAARATAPIE